MAHNDEFNGYEYLVDTNGSRQYAIRFENDRPQLPFQVAAKDQKDAVFLPNEVISAFSDEMEVSERGGQFFVSTQAFQITVPPHADPSQKGWGLAYETVEYAVHAARMGEKVELTYAMTPASIQNLAAVGIDSEAFPETIKHSLVLPDASMRIGTHELLLVSPLLQNHADGALYARRSIFEQEKSKPRPVSLPTARPTASFNEAKTRAPESYKIKDHEIEEKLKKFCKDLTELAQRGKLDPVVGRDVETDQALKTLTRRKQASLCFTGEAGVGKTAMFSAIAQRIADGKDIPETLENARVFELDLTAMNATGNAKFRGGFEEQLKPLIDGLKEREGILKGRKIILAIDEIHSQLTAGKAEGGTDSANMMKPFLTANGISVMGTTTDEEYKKNIEKDPALASRFEKMRLEQPDEKATVTIINRLWPLIKAHHKIEQDLSVEEISYIVSMGNRYAPNTAQPRKSEKVLDDAGASAAFEHRKVIERKDILSAVAKMSGLTIDFLSQNDHDRFLKLETELPKEVLGQPGLTRIAEGLIGSRSGLTDPNQPWGCFVLQGPTGTGKTETCKALARYLFGTEDAMIKLDMAEYADKHTVSRLIGAPPGFVGFDDAQPALTEKIRQRPYSILLLDEIEKAHPDVFNTLLPILNDGKMTDNHGKTVLFNNVIVIMTTNAGAQEAMELIQRGGKKSDMNLGGSSVAISPDEMEKRLTEIYNKAVATPTSQDRPPLFRPEMRNRINELGGFITFRPLTEEVINKLVVREVAKINQRLGRQDGANIQNVTLEVSPEVQSQIAKLGYDPTMGARPLREMVRKKISNQLGKWLMGNKDTLAAFVAENGGAKILISSVDNFAPVIMKKDVAVANDNVAAEVVAPVAAPANKKTGNGGPTI